MIPRVPSITLLGSSLKGRSIRLPKFFVYAWRREFEYLYIGKTKHGIKRLKKHNILKVEEFDLIDLWFCDLDFDMDVLEIELILCLSPKYNKQNNLYSVESSENIPSNLLMSCKTKKELEELVKQFSTKE